MSKKIKTKIELYNTLVEYCTEVKNLVENSLEDPTFSKWMVEQDVKEEEVSYIDWYFPQQTVIGDKLNISICTRVVYDAWEYFEIEQNHELTTVMHSFDFEESELADYFLNLYKGHYIEGICPTFELMIKSIDKENCQDESGTCDQPTWQKDGTGESSGDDDWIMFPV